MYARRSPRARSASAGFNFSTKILAQGKEATTPSIPPPATYPLAALSRDRGEGGGGLDRWEIKGNARRNLFNQELVDRLPFNDLTGFSGVIDRDRFVIHDLFGCTACEIRVEWFLTRVFWRLLKRKCEDVEKIALLFDRIYVLWILLLICECCDNVQILFVILLWAFINIIRYITWKNRFQRRIDRICMNIKFVIKRVFSSTFIIHV